MTNSGENQNFPTNDAFIGDILRDGGAPDGAIPVKLATTARIVGVLDGGRAVADATDEWNVEGLLRKAKARAFDPSVFDEEGRAPFFWRSEISSDVVDSYYTRMNEKTLRAFARDSKTGISFQYAHDWSRLGLGMSLDGTFETVAGGDEDGKKPNMRTVSDFFTTPGLRFNSEMGTSDFIDGVRAGVLRDVSVGFYADRILCGVCGKDMVLFWGYNLGECEHFPGMEYTDEENGRKKVCYAWVDGGHLSEVSQVHDGATPGAGHLKAQMWAESGKADARMVRTLEAHYRMKLPGGHYQMQSPGVPVLVNVSGAPLRQPLTPSIPTPMTVTTRVATPKEESVPEDDETTIDETSEDIPEEVVIDDAADEAETEVTEGDDTPEATQSSDSEEARAMLKELRARYKPLGITLPATVRATITGLADAVLRQKDEAKIGRHYRETLIDRGIAEGVRAFGKTWDQARGERMLRALSIEDLEATIVDWRGKGNERFPAGRATTDDSELAPRDGRGTLDESRTGLRLVSSEQRDDRLYSRA